MLENFTNENWKECLTMKRWERLGETEDVETMVRDFTEISYRKYSYNIGGASWCN